MYLDKYKLFLNFFIVLERLLQLVAANTAIINIGKSDLKGITNKERGLPESLTERMDRAESHRPELISVSFI